MNEQADHKILIVDDQFGIRALLREILQAEGYQTYEAANGAQALGAVQKEEPNLVLLDIKIPGMDGLEILRRIKNEKVNTKVMIMTAYGELEMIKEAMDHGAITHFSKPFDINEMLETIKKALSTSH
ncbi:MAG TPA: response regulator [Bacillales bacterium]|nr:response regulator [Bacillales bacterium]